MARLALTLLALFFATAAHAQSFVTVKPGKEAWWLRAEFRPLHTEVRGIPAKSIRAGWCKATELSRELLPRALLIEDGKDLMKEYGLSFSVEGAFDGTGTKQIALVGVYETCRGRRGHFLLIVDSGTRKVRFLDTLATRHAFAAIGAEDDGTIHILYCMECDISAAVKWDRKRKRFVIRGTSPKG